MKKNFRQKVGDIIFGHATLAGKIFDVVLLVLILVGTFLVIIETIPNLSPQFKLTIALMEGGIITLFTIEYILRIYSAENKKKYIFSLYGFIDFISVFPAYLSILFPPLYYMVMFRAFRVFRIFRVLKLIPFLREENVLITAIRKSVPKIVIFLSFILLVCVVFASFMYVLEGPANGFSDIPTSLYWTIVTVTTVGYGDITPLTTTGKMLASIIMLCGYGIIAVPTGIVFSEYNRAAKENKD